MVPFCGPPERPRHHCYYGKNFDVQDPDADLVKFCGDMYSPYFTNQHDTMTMAENLVDTNVACRFKLEAILKERQQISRLRGIRICYNESLTDCFEISSNIVKFKRVGVSISM